MLLIRFFSGIEQKKAQYETKKQELKRKAEKLEDFT
jgi:hypothetical protein